MKVEILRGADKYDPLNQQIRIVAREIIGDRPLAVGVAFSENIGLQTGVYMMEEIPLIAKRLASSFAQTLENDILRELEKITGIRMPMLGTMGNTEPVKEKVKPLLPKDILSELEPMEEKRIMENLGVAV